LTDEENKTVPTQKEIQENTNKQLANSQGEKRGFFRKIFGYFRHDPNAIPLTSST
jgi:hypothetical protein